MRWQTNVVIGQMIYASKVATQLSWIGTEYIPTYLGNRPPHSVLCIVLRSLVHNKGQILRTEYRVSEIRINLF